MAIKVGLEHRTTYTFDRRVRLSPHVVRLRPAPHSRTPVEAYSMRVEPAGHFVNWQQDPFGNWLARLVFPEPVDHLDITVGLVADLTVINPFDFFVEEYAERFPFEYEPGLRADLAPYLAPVAETSGGVPGPVVSGWRAGLPELPDDGVPIVDFLVGLNSAVHRDVEYSVRMEPGVQTPDTTLTRAIGSCRDSAWLLVSLLRQYGLAARFVSGYLVQLATDPLLAAQALDGPTGAKEDFTDLHAWAEVYVPGAGWIGLDPTSALFAGEGHIPLSATPDPASAAPITGLMEPADVSFSFANVVTRVHEDPRVTLPYTDEAWARVDALGEEVDRRLVTDDVRLTMGGEPTFVSVDDATSPEWTTDADGDDKRRLAGELARRLREIYAGGGLVHRGQGKWYPGEPLPRWQVALQWRTDGQTLWSRPELLADPWNAAEAVDDARARAQRLAIGFAAALGLDEQRVIPAYEDPIVPFAAALRRPDGDAPVESPDRIDPSWAAALDAGVGEPSGWVLPIVTGETWSSPRWTFRRGRLVLAPGDSPVGLRLPLDSISWLPPEPSGDPSYLESGPPLAPVLPSVMTIEADDAPPTALAFEARGTEEEGGFVFVFLPPTERLDDYVTLVATLEKVAAELDVRVVVEGYAPPPDSRLTQLIVTPDPGVIEVNLQPTRTWGELRDLTDTLYAAARETRLGTEKFDLDGSHTGTGGGNHITLGGPTPADSPLLRRPDLLGSLIRYWQRHPSLSYLFSGRFIGPTSQAPRFDEGRPEAVYEMDIALAELARLADQAQRAPGDDREEGAEDDGVAGQGDLPGRPWLVDRVLRHLLTDLTGNTHRAEFCIDKLYSPDSSRGRLGLLELRGFEMPPHPQMAMVQALLVRSLVSMFWRTPNDDSLVRWGTSLHEDFLLPQGVVADIGQVVADLRSAGIAFEQSWLDPFVEFRFPRLGRTLVEARGTQVEIELRSAIEPWHVLGEEATGSGTARYVDSSVERLQVLVRGVDPRKHLVTCQGVPVPLTSTGTPGEYYAGVRYRAWQPWSALHPTIEVHAPLRFDLVDAQAQVSLGGCTYHVVHPGGRAYEHAPVNAASAEARRASRFEPFGHTAGRIDVAAARERGARASGARVPPNAGPASGPRGPRRGSGARLTVLQDYSTAVAQPTLSPEPPRYDEVVAPDGTLRPAWRALASSAIGLTREELQRISSDIVRFLSDDGVRYSRPGQSPSWWRLDPVPIVVSAQEWAPLEVGLAQRAELLNAVLVDLYGPQTLLSSGVVPPEVVLGHSGFLRVLRGSTREPHPLLVTATDVTRTATGDWQVLADRTGAPSGIGYAMENRRVISRVVPELYRGAALHRVAPFFQAVRAAMIDAAPGEPSDPRVVLLSPGPQSETAYDQSFLASSLGFPLVQGSDLVVRDGIVWMRAFGRLERVDVIVRRVDASFSDPLELRGDSQLGVTGLVEAVRRGTVTVVNGLGSGVVENLGLAPFLARACEVLLDEPLRLPAIRSYWLGDPEELELVRARADELTIRTIDRSPLPADIDPERLLALVDAEPHRFVAQERPHHSQTVALGPAGVRPEPVAIRTFSVRHGSAYRTLLGGLGSIIETGRVPRSKDVWVLKERADEPDQRLLEVLPMTTVRAPSAMVPRVLEDMFWFGRYAERAEDTLRLVIAAHGLAQDFRARPWSAGGQTLQVLVRKLHDLSPGPDGPLDGELVDGAAYDDELRSVLLDPFRPGSVAQSIGSLRDAAQAVRDQLSPDVWRVFGAIDRAAGVLTGSRMSLQVNDSAGRMLTAISALHGVTDSMMRDDGWRMIVLGRAVERCQQVVRLVEGTVTTRRGIDVDRDVLTSVLGVAESAVTHRRRYRGYVRPAGVVELLMFDVDNPRSLAFNLERVAELLRGLPASTGSTRPERLLADLRSELDGVDLAGLVVIEGERRPYLEQSLGSVRGLLTRFADAVAEVHLTSAPTPRSFDLAGSS